MNRLIKIKFRLEGIHHRPECPIEEVKFLKHKHRHMFHFSLSKKVSHNDRDIEIIQFKRQIVEYLVDKYFTQEAKCLDFGRMSCEEIAEELMKKYDLATCEVLEDGENGALLSI